MNSQEDRGQFQKRKLFHSRKNSKQRQRKLRKKKRKKLASMSHRAEIRTVSYGHSFWNNYKKVMEWQHNYTEEYWRRQARLFRFENILLRQKLSAVLQEPESAFEEVDMLESNCSDMNNEEDEEAYDSQPEYEVTEEFLKFIQTSLEHKASRNQNKITKKDNNVKKATVQMEDNAETSEDDGLRDAPAEDIARRRNEEMKQLYGKESAKIHGMETAMHLGFIRKCDKTKPIIWPVVPLSYSSYNSAAFRQTAVLGSPAT